LKAREKLFQQAETILVRDELPIIPLYFYVGINYYDTNKIQGIYPNILDNHPLQCIRKVKSNESIGNQKARRMVIESIKLLVAPASGGSSRRPAELHRRTNRLRGMDGQW